MQVRPGVDRFLAKMSKLYELSVYTMGTRRYALEILKIIDPDKKYFANRLITKVPQNELKWPTKDHRQQRFAQNKTHFIMLIESRCAHASHILSKKLGAAYAEVRNASGA